MTTIDIRHAKRQLYRIWQWAAAGEQIVLSDTGGRIARSEPRRPGLVEGWLTEEFFEPLPEDELAAWQQ